MSYARDALVALRLAVGVKTAGPRVTAPLRTAQVLALFDKLPTAVAAPPPADLRHVAAAIRAAWQDGQDLSRLSRAEHRLGPWAFFSCDEPLARLPGLMEAFLDLAKARAALRRAMVEAWLSGFSRDDEAFADAGAMLRTMVTAHPDDRRLEGWRAADAHFAFFDAREGPRRIALALAEAPTETAETLAAAGLADPMRAVSGYARAVQNALASTVAARLAGKGGAIALDGLFAVAAPNQALRFADGFGRAGLANALLGAWTKEGAKPDAECRTRVQAFLLKHLGDPRIDRGRWKGVSGPAIREMSRWLAEATLTTFFQIISKHASHVKQWEYRRAFWAACQRRGGISEAWIALGSRMSTSARRLVELQGGYARLDADNDKALLLMRVGNLVICEWSDNGKVRAWKGESSNAPALYSTAYSRSDVVKSGEKFPAYPRNGVLRGGSSDRDGLMHMSPETGHWQRSVALLLAGEGCHVKELDWKWP